MVAFAYQVAIADPICAAPSCDALSAAGGSYMPAEPITAGAACYPVDIVKLRCVSLNSADTNMCRLQFF